MTEVNRRTITPEFTVVWPHLFTPYKHPKDKGEPKYSCEMLFDKEEADLAAMKQIIKDLIGQEFPGLSVKDVVIPIKDGDVIAARMEKRASAKGKSANVDHYRNKFVLRAKSTYTIPVCDASCEEILDARRIFAGCIGRAEITFGHYENELDDETTYGVTAYLNAYQHIAEGNRIGGRDVKRIFGSVSGQSNEDPESEDIAF